MSKYSLRTRMMILILAPVLIIGLLLSSFFITHRYHDLYHQLENTGANIIEPLAIASEYEIKQHNPQAIEQIIGVLHRSHSNIVRAIALYDSHHQLRMISNTYVIPPKELKMPAGMPPPTSLLITRKGDMMILRTPISSSPALKSDLGYVSLLLDMKPMKLRQYREITLAGSLIAGCLLCALLFVWRLTRSVTSPILSIVHTVDLIRQGQLSSRVTGNMPGEMEILKNGINTMAASLAAHREEMQHSVDQATADLRETLEQLEIQNVELDLAKKRAQQAARSKSAFLANMSHELRTPLNGVLGFTRVLLKTGLTTTQRDHLDTIERSASNLLSLINNVLDFSKLDAEKFTLEHIPFSLRWMLDDIVTLLANAAHDKNLELTLNIDPDVPDNVNGDPLRLQQIFSNLVGNAIKFTDTGNIDILINKRTLTASQLEIDVQIRDSGIGIPLSDQQQLFQAFRQADASITRRHGGTGLGLTIAQRLINEMGGNIRFHSEEGRGTTFYFHIRLTLNEQITEGDPCFNNTHNSHNHAPLNSDQTPNTGYLPGQQFAPPDHRPPLPLPLDEHNKMHWLAGKRLAFVEANPIAAQNILEMLASTPLNITYSPSIADLPARHFDIMLIDAPVALREPLSMRHQSLAQAARLTDCLLLALPCHAQVNAELLKQQGVAACLQKPVTATRLMPVLLEQCAAMPAPTACSTSPAPPFRVEKLPMTVMAVDDNPANLKLMAALLDDRVQHIVLCQSGMQAVQQAQQHSFDLIFMDIQMPDIDGLRACEMIRRLPGHQHTPIIAVTAHLIDDASINATACNTSATHHASPPHPNHHPVDNRGSGHAGMNEYLEKPIAENKLYALLLRYQRHHPQPVTPPALIPTPSSGDPPVLDWQLALRQSAGNSELAHDLLHQLAEFLPQVRQHLHQQLDGEASSSLAGVIHKLHGSCCYTGACRLQKLCHYIEKQHAAYQKTHPQPFKLLTPELLELLDEISHAEQAIAQLLNAHSPHPA